MIHGGLMRMKDKMVIEYFTCYRCKKEKHISEFTKDKKRKSGIRTICKICNVEYTQGMQRKYPERHKIQKSEISKRYLAKNKDRIYKSRKNNREAINKYFRKYFSERYKTDPEFKLRHRLAKRILTAIQREYKSGSTLELIGCSIDEAKKHIESQFKDGMTWENHGLHGWHIDHIKPCASFDLTDPEQQKECFHYTNLQPLWAEDNMKKGGKYE